MLPDSLTRLSKIQQLCLCPPLSPLAQSKHSTLSSPGKAEVSVDLVLPVRLLLELDKSDSDRSMQSGDKDAGAGRLLRFLTTLEKVSIVSSVGVLPTTVTLVFLGVFPTVTLYLYGFDRC